jgi:hypothetical protein
VIDRIIYDGREWFLVDYKTNPLPEKTPMESFFSGAGRLVLETITALPGMLAHARSIDPALSAFFCILRRYKKSMRLPE